jgi:ubiquitin-protein ligase E3 C
MTELYHHLLLTMGDDEFFAPSRQQLRNPLTLDEVGAFSKQLLGIAFPLYWQQDQYTAKQRCLPDLRITWESVRDKCTRCMQALHAREYVKDTLHRVTS